MKQSVTQILDFFKKHKYGRLIFAVLVVALIVTSGLALRTKVQEKPIPLSQVAAAISAERVVKIDDSQYNGLITIHYKDGTQKTTLRDTDAPFLEQMKYLGVSESD